MKLIAATAFALALASPVVAETSLTAYEAARQALLAIWAELPLTLRNATLTNGAATGYGNYAVHEGNSYGTGETIHVYVEVLGYGWLDNGNGTLSEKLDGDLNLLDTAGATVATQKQFITAEVKSRTKLLETYLTFDATLSAFGAGNYKLQFVLHDRATEKDASFEVPITLTGPESPSSSAAPSSSEAPASSAQ